MTTLGTFRVLFVFNADYMFEIFDEFELDLLECTCFV